MANIVNDAINARQAGAAELQGFTEGLAQKRAGRNMASGNLQGAAADLYGAGMLDAGLGVERVGQQRQDRAAAQEAGAVDQEKARQAESLKFMAQAAGVLQKIPEDQRSQAYIEKIAPALKAMGAPDDVISQAGQHLDDQSLQLFSGQVEEALKGVVMAPGSQLRDPKTGALLAEAPFAPSFQKVGEGETLLQVGGATPSGASGGGGARNQRNNNPGNIEDGPFAQSLPGYQGSDGRFAIFADAGSGRAAQGRLLQSYGQRGFDTVEKIINRWAPPSDNNPTGAYVNFVAKRLGVPAGQQLDMTNPQVVQALAGAIEEFEGGGQSASNQGGGARVLAQGGAKREGAPSGFRWNADQTALEPIPGGPSDKPQGVVKLAPQDSKYISEARTSAQGLAQTIPLVDRFIELNTDVGTGGALSSNRLSSVAGAFNPKIAEMRAIADRLTPAMRQGMPGAASDRDVAMFQSATVGLGKPGPANQSVGRALKAGAKRQGEYVAFLENYAKTNGSLLGAQEEWDAYAAANPMFDQDANGNLKIRPQTSWRQYFGVSSPTRSAPTPAKTAPAKRPSLDQIFGN